MKAALIRSLQSVAVFCMAGLIALGATSCRSVHQPSPFLQHYRDGWALIGYQPTTTATVEWATSPHQAAALMIQVPITGHVTSIAWPHYVRVTGQPNTNLWLDLAAYYNFDENMEDQSGQGHAGASGHAAYARVGGRHALYLDGVKDRVEVPSAQALGFSSGESLTLAAWIYPLSTNGVRTILCKGRTTRRETANYHLRLGSGHVPGTDGRPQIGFWGNRPNEFGTYWNEFGTTGDTVKAKQWQFVTATFTFGEPAQACVYVDGQPQSAVWVAGAGRDPPSVTSDPLWIGAINSMYGGVETAFHGYVDDVFIFRRALEPLEVDELYQRTR